MYGVRLTKNPVKAIRQMCQQCMGNCTNWQKEVKDCASKDCAIFPFRFGKNPYRTIKPLSEDRKSALVARLNRK